MHKTLKIILAAGIPFGILGFLMFFALYLASYNSYESYKARHPPVFRPAFQKGYPTIPVSPLKGPVVTVCAEDSAPVQDVTVTIANPRTDAGMLITSVEFEDQMPELRYFYHGVVGDIYKQGRNYGSNHRAAKAQCLSIPLGSCFLLPGQSMHWKRPLRVLAGGYEAQVTWAEVPKDKIAKSMWVESVMKLDPAVQKSIEEEEEYMYKVCRAKRIRLSSSQDFVPFSEKQAARYREIVANTRLMPFVILAQGFPEYSVTTHAKCLQPDGTPPVVKTIEGFPPDTIEFPLVPVAAKVIVTKTAVFFRHDPIGDAIPMLMLTPAMADFIFLDTQDEEAFSRREIQPGDRTVSFSILKKDFGDLLPVYERTCYQRGYADSGHTSVTLTILPQILARIQENHWRIDLRRGDPNGLGMDLAMAVETDRHDVAKGSLPKAVDALWDIGEKGLFERNDQGRVLENGRAVVDLDNPIPSCPTALGTPKEIVLRYRVPKSELYFFQVAWHPGDSGQEQFEIRFDGKTVATSLRVDAATCAASELMERVSLIHRTAGQHEIVLRQLSGDGIALKQLILTESPTPSRPIKPGLQFPNLAAYEKEIKEPGIVLDSDNVRLFAPKSKEKAAQTVFPYLVKAYDEYYRLVGVHTAYKIMVYHFPENNPNWRGGTSECSIWYGYKNLDLEDQPEWRLHQVPHVMGYIEEMGHNFVAASQAMFGWEMVGAMISRQVTATVAGNPTFSEMMKHARPELEATYRNYRAAGNVFPKELPANLCDRIHAWILWDCEQAYGPRFWPNFFREIGKQRLAFRQAGQIANDDNRRNAAYRITVDCFDRLMEGKFKTRLTEAGISLTTDVKSLQPMGKDWNRRLE